MKKTILLSVLIIFILGCTPETITITKYQCQNGQVVDSIDLCEEQKCPECPVCPEKVCETVKEPYVERRDYTYTYKYGIISDKTLGDIEEDEEGNLNYITKQITKIKNFDDKKGFFTIKHHYRTLKKEGTKENSTYINASDTKEFKTTFDTALGEDVEVTTEITPPTETRYKEVIKYKEVERCSCE